jgi:hypothetical protein
MAPALKEIRAGIGGAGFYRFPALGFAEAERCQATTQFLPQEWPTNAGHSSSLLWSRNPDHPS